MCSHTYRALVVSITVWPSQIARMRLWHGSKMGEADDAGEDMARSCQIGRRSGEVFQRVLTTDDRFKVDDLYIEHEGSGDQHGVWGESGCRVRPPRVRPVVDDLHLIRT